MLPLYTCISFYYNRHLGPKYESAGLTIELHEHADGIIFTCSDKEFEASEYYPFVVNGFNVVIKEDKIIDNFEIYVHDAKVHDVDSSPIAFQKCAYQVLKAMIDLGRYAQQVDAAGPADAGP